MNAAADICVRPQVGAVLYPCLSTPSLATPGLSTPSPGNRLHQQTLVLVHGWGADSQIWGQLPQQLSQWVDVITLDLPGFGESSVLQDYSADSLLDWMQQTLPDQCLLLGLSLGGMLCQRYAATYPQRVTGLISISTNNQFVADSNYQAAMPRADFEAFIRSWQSNPSSCLKRFAGLQARADSQQRQLTRQLRAMDIDFDFGAAGALLKLLGELKISTTSLSLPSLSLFGDQDALVPVQAANQVANARIIAGAGHLSHLSAPQQVIGEIKGFLDNQRYRLDKPRVADSFGRAAPRYDSAAKLQHRIGEQLLAHIKSQTQRAPDSIMDLGCGTGYHSIQLQQCFPEARVLGLDISAGMLAYAETKYRHSDLQWLCGDAENLALATGSQGLIFSNFALQWCTCLETLAAELYRVLQPGGQLVLAVPGPETLSELRQAWAKVDNQVHINRFASLQQWQGALAAAGFSSIELTSEPLIEQHQSVRELLLELKNVGAHNNNAGKSLAVTGKQRLKALYNAYENYRLANGELPATWEIISGVVSK